MTDKYIIEDGNVVPCNDLMAWGQWMQDGDRRVARTQVGESDVSTVFLGLDRSFGGGTPLLFETMVFGGALDQEQERYSTRDEAIAGHEALVARIQALSKGDRGVDILPRHGRKR